MHAPCNFVKKGAIQIKFIIIIIIIATSTSKLDGHCFFIFVYINGPHSPQRNFSLNPTYAVFMKIVTFTNVLR